MTAASMVPAASLRSASTCVTAASGVFDTESAGITACGTSGVVVTDVVTDETVAPISVRRMTSPLAASVVGFGAAVAAGVADADAGVVIAPDAEPSGTTAGGDDALSDGVPIVGVPR